MQANTAKAALAGCAIGAALYFAVHGGFDIDTSGKQAAEANHPAIQEGSAAKVAAVMADNGITLPQVAAYLNTYGFDVTPRSAWIRAHWKQSIGADYHIFRPYIATADTAIEFQVRGNITGTWPADVIGADILPDGRVVYGPWSDLGWRGGGDGSGAIPGIAVTGHDALSGPGGMLPGVVE